MSKLVMSKSGVAVVWNAKKKPGVVHRELKILAGPELLEEVEDEKAGNRSDMTNPTLK